MNLLPTEILEYSLCKWLFIFWGFGSLLKLDKCLFSLVKRMQAHKHTFSYTFKLFP